MIIIMMIMLMINDDDHDNYNDIYDNYDVDYQ